MSYQNVSAIDMNALRDTFEISIHDEKNDLENKRDISKLKLNSEQKTQVSALVGQIPSLIATETISNAYVIKFPKGMKGMVESLMRYADGGVGSSIIGEKGVIAHASFHSLSAQATVYGMLNTMAIVSGQHFLSEINGELKKMKLSIDKILEFLYGDKRAELMSEVSFVKYAYENYSSIMAHDNQRAATISSLQEAKKVAMKDIEFYMNDLDSTANQEDISDIGQFVNKVFQTKDSLDFSMQLYVMSSLLEIYYAQNYDSSYIRYVEKEMCIYIDKCDKRTLADFSVLNKRVDDYRDKFLKKPIDKLPYKKRIEEVIETLNNGEESALRKSLRSGLHIPEKEREYYITSEGNMYFKVS